MKKVAFIGFSSDYNVMEKKSLEPLYQVTSIDFTFLSRILNKLDLRLLNIISYNFLFFLFNIRVKGVDVIFLNEHIDNLLLSKFKNHDIKTVILLRNKIDDEKFKNFIGFDCYTFDKANAQKYGFKLYNQYASGFDFIKGYDFYDKFDLSFLGLAKSRQKILDKIRKYLSEYRLNVVVLDESKIKRKDIYSYENYLVTQLSSKVVLDIVSGDNIGVTMRTIEALVAGKKVLTNNPAVLEMDVYSESNILYIKDFDDIDKVKKDFHSFFDSEFDPSVNDILDYYSPRHVLSSIVESY